MDAGLIDFRELRLYSKMDKNGFRPLMKHKVWYRMTHHQHHCSNFVLILVGEIHQEMLWAVTFESCASLAHLS